LKVPGNGVEGVKDSVAVPPPKRSRIPPVVGVSWKWNAPAKVNGAASTPPVKVVGITRRPDQFASRLAAAAALPTGF